MSDRDDQYAADVTTVGDIIGMVPDIDDEDNPYNHARRVLKSDWLAARDARVKAEALEEAAGDIDTHFQDLPSWTESYKAGERSDDWMKGATRMVIDAIQRLRARAAEYRRETK